LKKKYCVEDKRLGKHPGRQPDVRDIERARSCAKPKKKKHYMRKQVGGRLAKESKGRVVPGELRGRSTCLR